MIPLPLLFVAVVACVDDVPATYAAHGAAADTSLDSDSDSDDGTPPAGAPSDLLVDPLGCGHDLPPDPLVLEAHGARVEIERLHAMIVAEAARHEPQPPRSVRAGVAQ